MLVLCAVHHEFSLLTHTPYNIMATRMGLSQPNTFLPEPGQPIIPWKQWIAAFNNYLLAMGGHDFPAARKKAILLHCLGLEGQRIYDTLPERSDPPAAATDYDNAVFVLELHFTPHVNVVAERYRFRQRSQQPGESIDTYIAVLRNLSKTCKFGTMTDEMIRDQLIEKTNQTKIRERLLMEEDLTLSNAVTLARSIEDAQRESKLLENRPNPNLSVNALKKDVPNSYKSRPKQSTKPSTYPQHVQKCYRCGSSDHLANYPKCFAKTKQCNACKKIGHLTKYCLFDKSKRSTVFHVTNDDQENFSDADPDVPVCDPEDDLVLAVHNGSSKTQPIYATIQINHLPIQMMVDTGSGVTLLSKKVYDKYFLPEALESCEDQRLSSYTDHTIEVIGKVKVSVMYKDRITFANVYVVNNKTNILGRDLIQALKLSVNGQTLTCNAIENNYTENVKECRDINVTLPENIKKFSQMFKTAEGEELNCVKGFSHKVKVNNTILPVQQKLRRLPFSVRDKVSAELKRLENLGVIEKIDSSEWISPIVVSYKKNGSVRVCVDLREVNKAIIPDKYPLPKIDELISELRNSKYFSQLDLASAYHQIKLHPDSRDLTSFITHDGVFRYKRICFGMSSAPSAFQKMLSTILSGLQGVQNYLDDVIVYGRTKEEHDQNLYNVMSRLNDYGITLNNKCKFGQTKLEFLGHKITSNGVQISDEKFRALCDIPVPEDSKALKSFLGLAGYFSDHIPQFACIVEPLRALTRKNCKFNWSDDAQTSFEKVKQLVKENMMLSMFDPELETIVTTDASGFGLGAVLSQIRNGKEVIVACASRTLSKDERKYSIGELEALACVWACQKWHCYLWGRPFTLCTDHQALVTLLTKRTDRASMRILRWSCKLMNYNYIMKFKKGTDNKIADTLSRLPVDAKINEFDVDDEVICNLILNDLCKSVSLEELTETTNKDETLQSVKKYVQNGWPYVKLMSLSVKPYYYVRDELSVCNDIVMRNERIVVPEDLTSRFINLAHETHPGMTKTKQRLRSLYWWPLMDTHVENFVKHCTLCQANDKSAKPSFAPLKPVPFPDNAWDKLCLDIVGPFELATNQCKYCITLMDYYSKWPEVGFVNNVSTQSVIDFLKTIFSREGFPKEIITDNGAQFKSKEFSTYLSERGIRHGFSSVYYPQSNGAIERYNGVLKTIIQNAINNGKNLKNCVQEHLAIYRATPHSTTGFTPSLLLHRRNMRTKLNVIGYDLPKTDVDVRVLKSQVKNKQNLYKKNFDKKANVKCVNFNVGDWVRVKKTGFIVKGKKRFSDPVQIIKKLSDHTYMLSNHKLFNVSKLVKCIEPNTDFELEMLDEDVCNEPVQVPDNAQPVILRRSTRIRQEPKYLQDYVRF